MQWFLYALVVRFVFEALFVIVMVDKPLESIGRGAAAVLVALDAVIVTNIVLAAQRVSHA